MTRTPLQQAFFAFSVELTKAEIQRDIKAGLLPATVRTFSELHDHTDANTYGGLCDVDDHYLIIIFPLQENADEADREAAFALGQFVDAGNDIQNAVDAWLRAGGHASAAQHGLFEEDVSGDMKLLHAVLNDNGRQQIAAYVEAEHQAMRKAFPEIAAAAYEYPPAPEAEQSEVPKHMHRSV